MDRITSAKNPAVQRLRALKDAKARREAGLFLVEGEVMIREALGCGLKLRELVAEEAHADFAQEIFRQAGMGTQVIPVTTAEYSLSKAARPFNSRLDKRKLVECGFVLLPD